MRNLLFPLLGFIGLLAMSSCSKEVIDDSLSQAKATSTLKIVTRGDRTDDPEESPNISSGFIYIFSGNTCVSRLAISDVDTSPSAKLAAGTYTLYAVGGEDILSRFSFPEQNDANAKSEITQVPGKAMDDLLMCEASVTLKDGEEKLMNLALERKVISIEQVTINNVPEDVDNVEVQLEPLYKKIYLDGTYPTETGYESVELTEDGETEGLWSFSSHHYCFPASTKPTITVSFTIAENTKSYSYISTQDLPANHKLKIVGTYTEAKGVTLSGILTGTDWGEDITISFDFDEDGSSTSGDNNDEPAADAPVQGSTYLGCYVVSVDQDAKTAVLLSPTKKRDYSVDGVDQEGSIAILNAALQSWSSESEAVGTWRIPTLDEAQIFLGDVTVTETIGIEGYYCFVGSVLKKLSVQTNSQTGENEITGPYPSLSGDLDYLRPVINITY